jgi:tRNA U-34 5-methylaminomethyl-2-thiouridine biosynthesis protein MnmC
MKSYDYIIIGGGVAGCSVAYELAKYSSDVLIIDENDDVALGASGAAGAFLSPLLGKPNGFKDLVTKALIYSTKLYKEKFSNYIDNCGTTRIPKDEENRKKFEEYIPYMDFEYTKEGEGFYFPIGSVVDSYNICKAMVKDTQTLFNHKIKNIEYQDDTWILDNSLQTKNLILATGIQTDLIKEFYINIRAVWGRRIDVKTTTRLDHNYHKECSLSKTFNDYLSIGATHHRDKNGVEDREENHKNLLKKANDIKELKDIEIIKDYVGARASSVDYFPMIGDIIDGDATLELFPYLKNGTHVQEKRFIRYNSLYIINGVGGRGFVLSPYLAKILVEYMIHGTQIDSAITVDRLFKRDVKRIKN